MSARALQVDDLLRAAAPPRSAGGWRDIERLLLVVVIGGALYGMVMGSYGGLGDDRPWQVLYSACKVPLLLLATFALSLPSFFVLNTLLGVRADFGPVLRALVGAQGVVTLVLAALAPYTAFWYVSFRGYSQAVLFNGAMFAIASIAGQWQLRRWYRPLCARNRRHRLLRRTWLVLYVFVGIQMAWVLRPFVGDPRLAPQFFRSEAWGNAYVVVARMVWRALVN